MEITYTIHQLKQTAEAFWKMAPDVRTIAFHGNMGSGKTTFIHALCDARHVKDVVGSPTFSIINEYYFLENGTEKKIFHIDLYRLRDEQDAVQAGVEDCLYSGDICLVEWPARAEGIFPEDTARVEIQVMDPHTRIIHISGV